MADKAHYDRLYQEGYRSTMSGIELARAKGIDHFASHIMQAGPVAMVLDYGAGAGLHTDIWQTLYPDSQLFFADISSIALEELGKKYPQYKNNLLPIQNHHCQDEGQKFDLIASIEVMEHVEEVDSYLQDISRLLKPGGFFLWTTPCGNPLSIEHIYSKLTGQIESTKDGKRRWTWEDPTHIRRFTSKEVKQIIKKNGFNNIKLRYRAHLFSFLVTRYWRLNQLPNPIKQNLLEADYKYLRCFANAASMIGCAQKPLS
ncbi:MAG: methyltransferase domain-containing protein [Magnetococcales bacterium]|nr:methyltransferase domain-containing protein [Magnetococcales bacterium]